MSLILSGSDGVSDIDGTASTPAIRGTDANTGIFFPAADTIAFAEGGTESMRLDSSGNLLVGTTTTPNQQAVIYRTSATTSNGALLLDGNGNYAGLQFAASGTLKGSISTDLSALYVTHENRITFNTGGAGNVGGTERMRITSSGFVKASNTGSYVSATGSFHEMLNSVSNNEVLVLQNSASSLPYGITCNFTGASPNNTSQYFLFCADTTNAKAIIYSNGTVQNRTGTYTTISDLKLKENVVDATPKLDKLNQVRVVNYNLIDDELKQIGFVAQELEQVFPSLVFETPDLDENKQPTGEVTKGVKLSVFVPILVKAIQELNAKVEAQAAEIAALKNQPTE